MQTLNTEDEEPELEEGIEPINNAAEEEEEVQITEMVLLIVISLKWRDNSCQQYFHTVAWFTLCFHEVTMGPRADFHSFKRGGGGEKFLVVCKRHH